MIGTIPQFEAPILTSDGNTGILGFLGFTKCCDGGAFGLSYCCKRA
ncbi:MAG: hypothetical protein HXS54_16800 [Theionarchaea archaeon]|nr:hypothetical protein [Theionarchaea archaeon]